MKFATIGHLVYESSLQQIPKEYVQKKMIVTPEFNFNGTKGHILGLKLSAQQMMELPINEVRQQILDIALFAQNILSVNLIQLGALTTSVTSGGKWLSEREEYAGVVNHGDSYTAAVTSQTVEKALKLYKKRPSELVLAIVGAYGIIGEALSKILVPSFAHSILIGRREEKLEKLSTNVEGSFDTTTDLKTKDADIIVTATSHPKALLKSTHLKKGAIIVDVSQPPNLSLDVCQRRSDICRIDGGYVDFPTKQHIPIPGVPCGKLFSCIVEVVMQAIENESKNHIGSIELKHLRKTEVWGEKHGYTLKELTNFGTPINQIMEGQTLE